MCLSGAPWERRKARLGYVGSIRAVEVTYGWSGWHPHCHAVLLFEKPLSEKEIVDLESWLYGRWSSVVEGRGFGSITRAHGVDVRAVSREGLGEYLTKVEGGWSAGAEVARGHLKRGGQGVTPFEILAKLTETGEVRWLRLWQEYEAATFGKRAVVWSKGLRARLLPLMPERSDEELAAAEGADRALVRFLVAAGLWRAYVGRGTTGQVLDAIEMEARSLIAAGLPPGEELGPVLVYWEDRE
jgi:hypothetical protein